MVFRRWRAKERAASRVRVTGLTFENVCSQLAGSRPHEHRAREHERKQDHEAGRLSGLGAAHCQRTKAKIQLNARTERADEALCTRGLCHAGWKLSR